jgi:hypothetical protein
MTEPPPGLSAFGSDRFERRPGGEILLICPHTKGWNARGPGGQTRAAHPGTAVSWAGELFEVVGEVARADGGVVYRLAAWPQEQTIRTLEAYDEPSEAHRAAVRAETRRDSRLLGLSLLLAPLVGLLPGSVQRRMERDFGAPARTMTLTSGLVELAVGVVGWLFGMAAALGGGFAREGGAPFIARLPLPLCVLLILDASVRLASAFVMERAMGTIVTELPYALLRRRREPGAAEPPAATRRRDRYHMLEAVLALLPEAEQIRLRGDYGFDPILWGRRTAALLGLVGGVNAALALVNAAVGAATPADLLWLLAGGGLAIEQVARRRRLRQGRPAGSVLGALVRPFASPLFAPRPPASPS